MNLLQRLGALRRWLTDRHHFEHPLSSHPRHVSNWADAINRTREEARRDEPWGLDWQDRDD